GTAVPYARLVDDEGNALPLYNKAGRSQSYLDTAGQGLLLDWTYRPYDELFARNNHTTLHDLRFNQQLTYNILPGLDLGLFYQYNNGFRNREDLQTIDYYQTRNRINEFIQLDDANHTVLATPYPIGDVLFLQGNNYRAHNFRAQAGYQKSLDDHHVSTIVG